jgi:hypothetical protein
VVGTVAEPIDAGAAHAASSPGDDGDAHALGVNSKWRLVSPRNR